MRIGYVALLFFAAGLAAPLPAHSGPMEDATFALHRKPYFIASKSIPNLCPTPGQGSYDPNYSHLPCINYSVTDQVQVFPGPHVYLVVAQVDRLGMVGASCGISYNSTPNQGIANEFIEWTGCTDGEQFVSDGGHGDWPQPEGGIRITWPTCQTEDFGDGVYTVMGAFYCYAYSEDILKIVPNANTGGDPELAVTDCQGTETNLLDIHPPYFWEYLGGRVHFGGDGFQGLLCPPPGSIERATWGRIKDMFKD